MKVLPYTFRTNPFKEELATMYSNLFIFGKLKNDFVKFCELIKKEKPDLILGIARSSVSKIETITANRFNKKKILLNKQEAFRLHIPDIRLKLSNNMGSSFCNWTTYKLSNFIQENKLNIKVSFIHLNIKYLVILKELR